MNNYRWPALLFVLISFAFVFGAGCVYESEHLKPIQCTTNGERQGDAVCIDNLWIHEPMDVGVVDDTRNHEELDAIEPPLDANPTPHDVETGGTDAQADVVEPPDDIVEPDIDVVEQPDVPQPPVPNVEDGDACTDSARCISGFCDMDMGVCAPASCNDQQLSIGEVDIDCGPTCGNECAGYLQVAVGNSHTCARRADSTVMCWGPEAMKVPQALQAQKFTYISAGYEHTCGITEDETIKCWGKSSNNRLVAGDSLFTALSVGTEHACGVRKNGTLHCWGRNQDKNVSDTPSSTDEHNPWTGVAAGNKQSCAYKRDGTFQCWGRSNNDRIKFNNNSKFSAMTAASYHTCGINKSNSHIVCVGMNDDSITGDGLLTNVAARAVVARDVHACMIRTDNKLYCWGKLLPQGMPIMGSIKVIDVAVGWVHSCAITKTGGKIACIGDGASTRYPAEFSHL